MRALMHDDPAVGFFEGKIPAVIAQGALPDCLPPFPLDGAMRRVDLPARNESFDRAEDLHLVAGMGGSLDGVVDKVAKGLDGIGLQETCGVRGFLLVEGVLVMGKELVEVGNELK